MAIIPSSKNTSLQQGAWFNIDIQGIQQQYLDSGYNFILQWKE
jgi:hypothetical protein